MKEKSYNNQQPAPCLPQNSQKCIFTPQNATWSLSFLQSFTVLAHFWTLWPFQQVLAILKELTILAIFDHFGRFRPFWPLQQVWAKLQEFTILASFDHFGQF